jgi:murein DD-endopeptidase MepM/ murein hydrolase activator NlpD
LLRSKKSLSINKVCGLLFFTATLFCASEYVIANNFHGYFCPIVQVSPMHDDVVYTPAGLGIITSKAGFRIHPITGRGDFHSGVDLAANLNDRVYNLLDGIVTRVGWRGALGVAVEVYHPYPNVRTICGHLNAFSVVPGQWVKRGQVLGFAGTTGRSTGVHVHYTVIKEDTKQYVEPTAFLAAVPKYVDALKTARAKATQQANIQKHKEETKANPIADKDKDENSGDDLPSNQAEIKPP